MEWNIKSQGIRHCRVVAVAFSEIALAASTSGRRTLALSPRDQYSSEEYKSSQQSSSSIQQMGAAGQFGASQQSASSYMSYESHQIVSTWSRLPAAFSQCQSVFERRVETSVAIEAVQTLYTQFQAISQYSSCSCGQATIDESHTAEFTQMITQVFTYWQSILTVGHEVYGSEWDSQFRGLFERFTPFVTILKGLSVSLRINLSALLIGLHLDLNVFGIIGIDLNVIIGGLGPLLGGVLGTVGNVVDGLVGGNGLLGNGLLGLGGSKGLLRE